jgi:hypothetical protein
MDEGEALLGNGIVDCLLESFFVKLDLWLWLLL